MALSKLEKAKRETMELWERKTEAAFCEDIGMFRQTSLMCGFCKTFENDDCSKCPVYIAEGGDCFRIYLSIDKSFEERRYEDAFTDCLAVLIYIHQF